MKRTFDIFFATIGLVLLAPVIAVAMLFTRLVVGRPILARQFRVGLAGRPFEMLRLRTKVARRSLDLSADAVESGTSGWRIEYHRPPVTQRIRRSRLDVLPQLWNVITGDMSLVGPRPMVWQDAVEARVLDHPRHSVRPGLTGPGQVRGRGDEPLVEQLEVEAAYAQQVTFRGDLSIMGRTMLVMLKPSLRA
ncbi:MAG: sugar transferase [Acidimicrobiales bacterium]|nr:sugar transferase [Acidimicrobiales bacterium]